MKLTDGICYKYRGVLYQKNRSQKCLTNLVEPRATHSQHNCEHKTFSYRGIPYTIKSKKTSVDLTTSFRSQKYRGINYLTHIVDLLLNYTLSSSQNYNKSSTERQPENKV